MSHHYLAVPTAAAGTPPSPLPNFVLHASQARTQLAPPSIRRRSFSGVAVGMPLCALALRTPGKVTRECRPTGVRTRSSAGLYLAFPRPGCGRAATCIHVWYIHSLGRGMLSAFRIPAAPRLLCGAPPAPPAYDDCSTVSDAINLTWLVVEKNYKNDQTPSGALFLIARLPPLL